MRRALPGELAARRLGADLAQLRAALAGGARDPREHAAPRGLRLDQAAAAWHALTSPRTVEVITGPAGTGKTRVLAAIARAWDGPVVGTATSQNATNGLRAAGIREAVNTTRLLAAIRRGQIPPGSLIVADEGSMISITHLAAITEYAARNGCKLVLAGDQEQLAAVEGGGAMMLLADRLGYVQLAEPVRFTATWERAASLRLRAGDATALDEYDQHGRIRGAPARPGHGSSRLRLRRHLPGRAQRAADGRGLGPLPRTVRPHPRRPDPPRPGRQRPVRPDRRGRRGLGRGSDHLPGQRPPPRGGRARPGPGQRGHLADRGHHPPRHHGPPHARPRPGDRPAPVH